MGILRFLLAVSVVLAHTGILPITNNQLVGGLVAVQTFFMISGFYMTLVLNQRYSSLKSFYFNRFLRLYPSYWLVLVVITLTALIRGEPTFVSHILGDTTLSPGSKLLMLVANVAIFGSDLMMFTHQAPQGLAFAADFSRDKVPLYTFHAIPQAWSLPVEMLFYAIAPYFVKSVKWIVLVLALSVALRFLTYWAISPHDPWTYRFFPTELLFFCLGGLCFYVHGVVRKAPWGIDLGLLLLGGLIFYMTNFDRVPVLVPSSRLFSGQLVQFYLFVVAAMPFIFLATKENKIDRFLGDLSYPIYISHLFVAGHVSLFSRSGSNAIYKILIFTTLFSIVLHAFQGWVEKKFKRLPSQQATAVAVGSELPSAVAN